MISKKLTTVIVASTIFVNALAPTLVSADTSIGEMGNGAESSNVANVTNNNTTSQTQNNSATITNQVTSSSNTGGNNANFNTGGASGISTGGAANAVSISNTANSNFMSSPTGSNNSMGTAVTLGGNGAFSGNTANVTNNNTTTQTQNNTANFTNNITSQASTGNNNGSENTGGQTSIFTGPVSNTTQIMNTANKNVMAGGSAGANPGTTLSEIGNGAVSTNAINSTNNNSMFASQNNAANFSNNVNANANTGQNNTNFNTGGDSLITTGWVSNWTGVANTANENFMSGLNDCGCATGTVLNEGGNGAFSGNTINATNNNSQTSAQNNGAWFSNSVNPQATTGDNSVSDGTGSFWSGGNQAVMTGPTESQTELMNTSNQNVMGNSGLTLGGVTFAWDPSAIFGSL